MICMHKRSNCDSELCLPNVWCQHVHFSVCDRVFVLLGVRWVQGPVAFQVQVERRISGSANVSPCTQTRRSRPTQTY